jgi:hypothetical protein
VGTWSRGFKANQRGPWVLLLFDSEAPAGCFLSLSLSLLFSKVGSKHVETKSWDTKWLLLKGGVWWQSQRLGLSPG